MIRPSSSTTLIQPPSSCSITTTSSLLESKVPVSTPNRAGYAPPSRIMPSLLPEIGPASCNSFMIGKGWLQRGTWGGIDLGLRIGDGRRKMKKGTYD
ncbi:hypothetical protein EV1_003869 [Malus domestica]